ncbi:MAG: endonuclease/exonuclease/phosphatase family protein [Myxococcales bacterium]
MKNSSWQRTVFSTSLLAMGACSAPLDDTSIDIDQAPAGNLDVQQTSQAILGNTGASLRVVTYNTAFMSLDFPFPVGEVDTNDGKFGGFTYQDRAFAIAQRILAADDDVVALNEVFSSDARKELISQLAATYPHYISEVRGKAPNPGAQLGSDLLKFVPDGLKPKPNNSGLMIFSKRPFEPFSAGASPKQEGVEYIDGMNGPDTWGEKPEEVSAVAYPFAANDDGLASKAVAMVRVKNVDGLIHNIAFTHMQADNKPGDPTCIGTRALQFAQIRDLIEQSLTANERATQPIYVIGDTNVIGGNKANPGAISEWQDVYQTGNTLAFFSCGNLACDDKRFMTDAWGFETSEHDFGESNNTDKARLDYFLHNKPVWKEHEDKFELCVQYISKAYDYGLDTPNGLQQLSDHFALRTDLNKKAPHCSANGDAGQFGPYVTDFKAAPTQNFGPNEGAEIKFPGSMQWVRIDQAGSYAIQFMGVNKQNFGFEVYAADDLSTPLPPFHGEVDAEFGAKYTMPAPPYYVRTFARDPNTGLPDRTATGSYTLSVHRYTGTSASEAMFLTGGDTQAYVWPGANQLEYPFVWFKIYTSQTKTGDFPFITMLLDIPLNATDSDFDVTLHEEVIVKGKKTYPQIAWQKVDVIKDPNTKLPLKRLVPKALTGNPNAQPKAYYLKMSRIQPWHNVPMTSHLSYGTTLTYLRPENWLALDMEDDWPDYDNIQFQFMLDGPVQKSACVNCFGPFQVGEGVAIEIQKDGPQIYADHAVVDLWKEGEYLADQCQVPVKMIPHLYDFTLFDKTGSLLWADAGNVDKADFWYTLSYKLWHESTPF